MGTNNKTLAFTLKRYKKSLMYTKSVGIISVIEEQNVTTVTIQVVSMKNCASTQYENEHESFATDLLKLT